MSIAKILVPLTGELRDKVALKTAIAVAQPFGAHIVALFVHLDPKYAYPYAGIPVNPDAIEAVLAAAENVAAQAEKNARNAVSTVLQEANIPLVEQPAKSTGVTASFKVVMGMFHQSILTASETSDLVVFGPISTGDGSEVSETFLDTLLKISRPILIAPEPPARIARKVAIGWDGSGVAMRAVQAALPFLKRAEFVDILTVDGGASAAAVDELREYLSLHGISSTQRNVTRGTQTTAEALLKAATTNGADLLIIGGYGHSYWRETLFGGVTAHIRWHATLPVFMTH